MAKLALKGGDPVRTKPFPVWPYWDGKEVEAAREVIESGKWGMAQGDRVKELEKKFAAYQDAAYGVASSSGTTALKVALIAAGLNSGDEVIVPAYTFVASATAVLEMNAVPVFADIDPKTYNIDPESVGWVITEKTRAIMPVHLAGLPADMDRLKIPGRKAQPGGDRGCLPGLGQRVQREEGWRSGNCRGFQFSETRSILPLARVGWWQRTTPASGRSPVRLSIAAEAHKEPGTRMFVSAETIV